MWRFVVWQMYVNVMEEIAMFILKIQDVCCGFIWHVGIHLPCYMASHPAIPQHWHSQQICQISRRKDHLHCPYLLYYSVLAIYLSKAQHFKGVWVTKCSVVLQSDIHTYNELKHRSPNKSSQALRILTWIWEMRFRITAPMPNIPTESFLWPVSVLSRQFVIDTVRPYRHTIWIIATIIR